MLADLEEVPSHYAYAMFMLDSSGVRRGPYGVGGTPLEGPPPATTAIPKPGAPAA